jgi:hypothetical protein
VHAQERDAPSDRRLGAAQYHVREELRPTIARWKQERPEDIAMMEKKIA